MNQDCYSSQGCQLDITEQTNVQCPFKPKIPYTIQNTFVQEIGQASYLKWQPSDYQKNTIRHNISNNNDISCCDKFDQLSQNYESSLQSQIVTMLQLNELIDNHSNLLETYLEKQHIHINKQRLPFVFQEQESPSEQWKQKWEQENKQNQKRDKKIKFNIEINKNSELQKMLEELEETHVQTDSYQITLELESWKSKYQNLTKINNQTAAKLKLLENELEQIKESSPAEESDQSKRTSVTTTRRRLTKQIEV